LFILHKVFGVSASDKWIWSFYEKGKKKTPRNGMVYGIEFNEIKTHKEDKLPNGTGGFSFGNPYVYGKINNFYSLQLGFGGHRFLGKKGIRMV
jgi:hypothetical protein